MKLVRLAGLVVLILLSVAVALAYLLRPDFRTSDTGPYTSPFFLTGYDLTETYSSFSKQSAYITLSDGTRLAADIFLPDDRLDSSQDASPGTGFPTILEYGPYARAWVEVGQSPWQRIYNWWATGRWEPVWDATRLINVRNFLYRGYAFVSVEIRGTGVSHALALVPPMRQILTGPWRNKGMMVARGGIK